MGRKETYALALLSFTFSGVTTASSVLYGEKFWGGMLPIGIASTYGTIIWLTALGRDSGRFIPPGDPEHDKAAEAGLRGEEIAQSAPVQAGGVIRTAVARVKRKERGGE